MHMHARGARKGWRATVRVASGEKSQDSRTTSVGGVERKGRGEERKGKRA